MSIFKEINPDDLKKTIETMFGSEACERCGSTFLVHFVSSRTQYEWDGEGENPNRGILLCSECEQEHNEYWDTQWNEYWLGRF